MATALSERPEAPEAADVAASTGNDDEPMNTTWGGNTPNRYFFREIEFNMDALGFLQFWYLDPLPAAALPGGGIDEVIADLMSGSLAPLMPAFFAAPAAPRLETPLDLRIKEPAFIILRLRQPRNMQFHPDLTAITHKDLGHQQYYGGLRHVNSQGASSAPVPDCKLIYFIVDPPDPVPPNPLPEYNHGFNLHVRLEQQPRGTVRRFLDIRIDPDVRYPGGGVGDP